ncbi:hypothetical protein EBZ37_03810 [bacterium]|nr:hypothetical protein [bacterium]
MSIRPRLSQEGFSIASVLVGAALAAGLALTTAQIATLNAKVQKTATASQTAVTEHESIRLRISNPVFCKSQFENQRLNPALLGADQPLSPNNTSIIHLNTPFRDDVKITALSFQISSAPAPQTIGSSTLLYGNLVMNYALPAGVIGSTTLTREIPLRLLLDSSKKVQSCGNGAVELKWGACPGGSGVQVVSGFLATGDPICQPVVPNPPNNIQCADPATVMVGIDPNGVPKCVSPPSPFASTPELCGSNGCGDDIKACKADGGNPIRVSGTPAQLICEGRSAGVAECDKAGAKCGDQNNTPNNRAQCEARGGTWQKPGNYCLGANTNPGTPSECKARGGSWVPKKGGIAAHCQNFF